MPMQRRQRLGNLAWVDLEMTGLDPTTDVILQAAVVITDSDLQPLEEKSFDIWQPEDALGSMTPFVRDMHEKSGILHRVRASRQDILEAERGLLERISGWCAYPAILCGNSIAQDRRFIERQMPGVDRYLHYRMIDVSSFKVLMRMWYGEVAEFSKPESGAHEALFDVHQSIAELRFYRERFLCQATASGC
jgi:oligoribonuclease